MIKSVIFDLDGTLYHPKQEISEAHVIRFCADNNINWEEFKKEFNAACKEIRAQELAHLTHDEQWSEIHKLVLKKMNLNFDYKVLDNYFEKTFQEVFVKNIEPSPGVKEFMEHLQENGIKIFVLSGTSYFTKHHANSFTPLKVQRSVYRKTMQLYNLGLMNYVEELLVSRSFGGFKPERTVYQGILDYLQIKGEECLMIGDSKNDVAAKKVGMKTIWVNNFKKDLPKEAEHQPDMVITRFLDKKIY